MIDAKWNDEVASLQMSLLLSLFDQDNASRID